MKDISWIKALYLLLIAALLGCTANNSRQDERVVSVKPFDWSNSPLTEVAFFNEMTTWFSASHRFNGKDFPRQRQSAFEAMARMGYEPAIAAVAMFDFTRTESKLAPAAFARLLEAAKAGDLSSQCALYPVYFLSVKSFPAPDPASVLVPLLKEGARRGHVVCQFYMGVFMDEGREGFAIDRNGAEPNLIAGAVAGLVRAQTYIAQRIGNRRIDNLQKAEEAICWIASTYRHSPAEGADSYASGIWIEAKDEEQKTGNRELLRRVDAMIDSWFISRNPALPRDTDPHECLKLRNGKP